MGRAWFGLVWVGSRGRRVNGVEVSSRAIASCRNLAGASASCRNLVQVGARYPPHVLRRASCSRAPSLSFLASSFLFSPALNFQFSFARLLALSLSSRLVVFCFFFFEVLNFKGEMPKGSKKQIYVRLDFGSKHCGAPHYLFSFFFIVTENGVSTKPLLTA